MHMPDEGIQREVHETTSDTLPMQAELENRKWRTKL